MDRKDIFREVCQLIEQILQLGGRSESFDEDTALLGAIPEFDSAAVVSLLTAVEEHYGVIVDDDEISGETFETVGTLTDFVERKVGASA